MLQKGRTVGCEPFFGKQATCTLCKSVQAPSAVVIRVRVHLINTITVKDWYSLMKLIYVVKDIVEKHKADFAFPTRTIHMHQ